MIPLPKVIVERWGAVWGQDVYLERPWWRLVRGTVAAGAFGYWRRCDDYETDYFNLGVMWTVSDVLNNMEHNADAVTALKHIAATDFAHPLPPPPPMPGQVWAWPEYGPQEIIITSVCRDRVLGNGEPIQFPPPNAVLVAGPTPWGRDVPWSPPTPETK